MRLPSFRFSIRSFMVALAVATVLAAGIAQAVRCVRVRSQALQQVEYHRLMLREAERGLAEIEDSLADPDEQALLTKLPARERANWLAQPDQLHREREHWAAAISRWQRLADHPWEAKPADLYRID